MKSNKDVNLKMNEGINQLIHGKNIYRYMCNVRANVQQIVCIDTSLFHDGLSLYNSAIKSLGLSLG